MSSLPARAWIRIGPGLAGFAAKQRALRAYRTQLLAMVHPLQRVPASSGFTSFATEARPSRGWIESHRSPKLESV